MFKSKLLYKIITIQVFVFVTFMLIISTMNLPKIDKSIQNLEERNAKNTLSRVVEIAEYFAQNFQTELLDKDKFKKYFTEILANTKIGKTGYIYVFQKDGKIIIHPNSNLVHQNVKDLNNPSSSNNMYKDLLNSYESKEELTYKWNKINDTKNYIYSKTSWIEYVPFLEWYIVSSVYTDEFSATSDELKKTIVTFGIFTLFFSIFITILFLKKILSPLERLSITVNTVTKGDYKARAEVTTNDEIGDLAKQFNVMINTIEDNIENLDRNVEQKTQELQELNSTLEEKVALQVQEIQKSDIYHKTIFDTVNDGIAILDLESNFLLVNNAYEKMTGYTKEELYHMSCIETTVENMKERSVEVIVETIEKGFYKNYKKSCISNLGHVVDVEMDIVLMPNKEQILITVKDITSKNQLERERVLQDKKMLEQSRLAQMGEMISMIAHQWRQPLGAISTTSINLQMKLLLDSFNLTTKEGVAEASEYFLKSLKEIDSFVQSLTTTIDDFRNFYKPNKMLVNVRLDDVIGKSIAIIKTSLSSDNIELIQEYNFKEEIELYDSEMMQVILNILKNAQDNFKEKEIKNPYIKIKTEQRVISICDNGGGIADDIIEHIFNPYFSTKNEKNGTGLGLYMSKIIVEEHHKGTLRAINRDNGVCFEIDLNTQKNKSLIL